MWVGDGQSTPFVWYFSSMTDDDYSHVVFPLLSSTLVLQRKIKMFSANNCMKVYVVELTYV